MRLISALVLFLAWTVAPQSTQPLYVERDSVRVVFWEGDEELAREVLRATSAPIPLPGMSINRPPSGTIFLTREQAVFDSLTSGGAPDWAAGVAIPDLRRIILPPPTASAIFGQPLITLRHELVHLALGDWSRDPPPRWFNEGYATWVSGGWDETSGWQLRAALLLGNLPPLHTLELGWPGRQGQARLAYLLSASAVSYLAESRGDAAFTRFMTAWREGDDFDAAFRNTFLVTSGQFEDEWRDMVRRRYGWLLALSQFAVFWIGVIVLLLILSSKRRERRRERLEELRREEYMLPPGDPPPG